MNARRALPAAALVACALALVARALPAGRVQEAATRFLAVDVIVDTGALSFAAWQVEIEDRAGRARITAVEGGEHEAFRAAPRHDPRALAGGRIVLAALSVDGALPSGPTRVATVHYALEGPGDADLVARLVAVGDADGRPIGGVVRLR